MDPTPAHRREPQRTWLRMLGLVAACYLLDGVLLAALAAMGLVPPWVAVAFPAAGLASCAVFHRLIASGWSERCRDSSLALPQLAVAAALQLLFIALAPGVAMYFVSVLFVVFGFGSLRLRPRQALPALALVGAALLAVFGAIPATLAPPTPGTAGRLLMVFCIATALARCTLLGLWGSQLRGRIARHYAEARRVLDDSDRRGTDVASALHDELGQELTGISLILSASARRLREEAHPGAPDVELAAGHLRAAIGRTRLLAHAARPATTPANAGLVDLPLACAAAAARAPRREARGRRRNWRGKMG